MTTNTFFSLALLVVGVTSYPFDENHQEENFNNFNYSMWNLDYVKKYNLPNGNGKGPIVYVFDTGYFEHPETRSNVIATYDFTGETVVDIAGHGSHCIGTIAGTNTGVAPDAEVVSVKVCSGRSCSQVDQALEWFLETQNDVCEERGCIISMSLGGGKRVLENLLINKISMSMNVVVVVAAGNEATDACDVSPASSKYALTIGSLDIKEEFSYFTNWGDCVDMYLPGSDILSQYFAGYTEMSGTSMATPLASGILANYWSIHPEMDSHQVKNLFIKDMYDMTYKYNMEKLRLREEAMMVE